MNFAFTKDTTKTLSWLCIWRILPRQNKYYNKLFYDITNTKSASLPNKDPKQNLWDPCEQNPPEHWSKKICSKSLTLF